jgi:DNA-binding sugar fermentation-stimulating protein
MVGSDLNAALEELAAARGDAPAYLEASKKILVQMEKLQEDSERSVSVNTDHHTKLLQEFIFSAKCVELRTPSRITTSASNGPSKY